MRVRWYARVRDGGMDPVLGAGGDIFEGSKCGAVDDDAAKSEVLETVFEDSKSGGSPAGLRTAFVIWCKMWLRPL